MSARPMPEPLQMFQCCEHCDHTVEGIPHKTPCDHGCNDDEVDS